MTGNVDKESVDIMSMFKNVMEGKETSTPQSISNSSSSEKDQETWNPMETTPGVTDYDISYMTDLMKRFEDVTDQSAENLNNGVLTEEVQEAYQTRASGDNVIIGNWEIETEKVFNEDTGKNRTQYNVVHAETKEPIAEELMIYESAYAISKLLNKGKTITDSNISNILILENKYERAYNDAKFYRMKMSSKLNESKMQIVENKFEDARSKALDFKKKIQRIKEKI